MVSICIALIGICSLIKCIFIPGPITILIIGVCLIGALCMFVLAEVFEKAIAIKDENDLTI